MERQEVQLTERPGPGALQGIVKLLGLGVRGWAGSRGQKTSA